MINFSGTWVGWFDTTENPHWRVGRILVQSTSCHCKNYIVSTLDRKSAHGHDCRRYYCSLSPSCGTYHIWPCALIEFESSRRVVLTLFIAKAVLRCDCDTTAIRRHPVLLAIHGSHAGGCWSRSAFRISDDCVKPACRLLPNVSETDDMQHKKFVSFIHFLNQLVIKELLCNTRTLLYTELYGAIMSP